MLNNFKHAIYIYIYIYIYNIFEVIQQITKLRIW